jgi:hypothetical protein
VLLVHVPTVIVLDGDSGVAEATRNLLSEYPDSVVVNGIADHSVVCALINEVDPTPPLVIIAAGRAALALPAVARSQRAMHRRVLHYLLIDPELPQVSDAWPDARVTVACDADSEASLLARLRGWDVLTHDELWHWRAPID